MNFNHPKDVCLNYWQHLIFAWKEAFFAMITFFIMILHGIVPWIFDIYFTDYIKGAQDRLNHLSELEE